MVQIKEEYDPDINYHEIVYRYAEEENQVNYYDHISIRNQVRSIWDEKRDIKPKIEPKVQSLDDDEPNGDNTTEKAAKRKRYDETNTMNGRKKLRRNGGKLNGPTHHGNGIEVKQEPTIKLEPDDAVDLVPVLASVHAPSGSSKLKPKRGPTGRKNAKKSVVTARNKPKAIICSYKKKPTTSKGMGKQHKCLTCDYSTSLKRDLEKHIRTHTGERPFPCTHCAKRFARKDQLQMHMRTHVSEFLFSCSNCLQGFSQNTEKSEHEISCTVRRYDCHLCKEYSTFKKSNLEYHMRVYHTSE